MRFAKYGLFNFMTHNTAIFNKHAFSQDIGQEVLRAIADTQFGSVEITIHAANSVHKTE